MLKRLNIRGYALFEDISLTFAPGLNVLTGETGAGKSLILNALALLLGARQGRLDVREGSEALELEAEFALNAQQRRLLGLGDAVGDSLTLCRTRRGNGKSSCTAAGKPLALSRMAELGRGLVEFAFQHQSVDLGSESSFVEALDALAGQSELAREYAQSHRVLAEAEASYQRAEADVAGRALRERRANERLALLKRLAPRPREYPELCERLAVLARARDFLELAARVKSALSEREGSVEDELLALVRAVGRAEETPSGAVRELLEALHRAQFEVQAAARAAERVELEVDVEPQELGLLEARRAELEKAADVLGSEPGALAEQLGSLELELGVLENAEQRLAQARQHRDRARQQARAQAEALHAARAGNALLLERRIEAELASLCLEGARLAIHVKERADAELGAHGITRLDVQFAANPGEPAGALSNVLSGGERSRLLLALRALGLHAAQSSLVFDETDAGVGGLAAQAIAQRLARLAAQRQILCVTHQACIAAAAAAHFRVHKTPGAARTHASVERLRNSTRIDELARMLAGANQGASARSLADELLRKAAKRTSKSAA
jgi:DNA repair protein RecN (Recombination protein N)